MTQNIEEFYAPIRENLFSSFKSFSIPVELLEKAELVLYVQILQNVVHRLQQKNQRIPDWKLSSHCRTDKAAKMPAVNSMRNPRFNVNEKAKNKFPCKYFLAGFCKYANACWYSHERVEKALNRSRSSRNSNSSPKNAKVKKITCKYFSTGFCKYGEYCWYSHHGMRRAQSAPGTYRYKSFNQIPKCSQNSRGNSHCSSRNEVGANAAVAEAESKEAQPQVIQHHNEDWDFQLTFVETGKAIVHDVKVDPTLEIAEQRLENIGEKSNLDVEMKNRISAELKLDKNEKYLDEFVTTDVTQQGYNSHDFEPALILSTGTFGYDVTKQVETRYKPSHFADMIKSQTNENVNIEQKLSDSYETSIEDIDLEQNKRFVEWLLHEIATGNKEIFFDKVLGENILKNGGIVCEKYMEKKRELFC